MKKQDNLSTLDLEQLAAVSGGFGWKRLASIATLPAPVALGVGLVEGTKAIYNHGKKTGEAC